MRNARIPSNPKPPNAHSARHKQFAPLIVFILSLQHTDAAKFQLRVYTLIIAYTISSSASMSNFCARQDTQFLRPTEKRSEFLLFKPFPLSDYSLLKKSNLTNAIALISLIILIHLRKLCCLIGCNQRIQNFLNIPVHNLIEFI